MSTALFFLTLSLGTAPFALLLDGPLLLGVESAALTLAIIAIAAAMRPGELAHFINLFRPVAIVAAIPLIIMVFQAMPLPRIAGLTNPIWQSAATALGQSLTSSISLNTGSTVLGICRYLAWFAAFLVAAAVTIDRVRAERVLFVTASTSVLIAGLIIGNDAIGSAWLDRDIEAATRNVAIDVSVVGILLASASAVLFYERFETRRMREGRTVADLLQKLTFCIIGFLICAIAVVWHGSENAEFAAVCGLVILFGTVLVRRLALGLAGGLAIATVSCLLAFGLATYGARDDSADLTLRFASQSSSNAQIAERIVSDSGWIGAGAGAYRDLVPIYGGDDTAGDVRPPSAAAELVVEWGRPLLWIVIALIIVAVIALLRAALNRGRDSFYPALGASVLGAITILSFGNAEIFNWALLVISASVLGLGRAQTRSRVVQPQ